ncbi:MAG: DegV family protein [Bacillota bacterium]|nr:DegV family protein [Bacillota bacterium]
MPDFVILCDSSADLGKAARKEHSLEFLPMQIFLDGKEYPASVDWEHVERAAFIRMLKKKERVFTLQVGLNSFEEFFRKQAKKGKGVLYIAPSHKVLGSYMSALSVGKKIQEEYPEFKFRCIDSMTIGPALGSLSIEASKLRKKGHSLEEVGDMIEEKKPHTHHLSTSRNLRYLAKADLVGPFEAFFYGIFGKKAIIGFDRKGEPMPLFHTHGRGRSIRILAKRSAERVEPGVTKRILIGHTACSLEAMRLSFNLKRRIPKDVKVTIYEHGPILSTMLGPSGISVNFIGKQKEEVE